MTSGKDNEKKNYCPDLEELVAFVLKIQESSWIDKHLKQCEICKDLSRSINAFRKEYNIVKKSLEDNKEVLPKALKSPEKPNDLIREIAEKLALSDTIEKRIRIVLAALEDEPRIWNREDE